MPVSRDQILDHVRNHRPLRPRELARALRIPGKDYNRFRRLIQKLVLEGDLVKLRSNRYGASRDSSTLQGRLSVNPAGFGFVIPESDESDVYISAFNKGTALHGDKVVVLRLPKRKRGPEGKIVKVLERTNPAIVGKFRRAGLFEFVEPDDPRYPRTVSLSATQSDFAAPGQQVVVRIDSWPTGYKNPEGTITEVLGNPEDPQNDLLVVARSHNLSLEFPPPVIQEAERIPEEIPLEEFGRREDLRDLPCITIDPDDAKDHDDAVSLQSNPDGSLRLGVHIADVSHYVGEGTALDKEASCRGTSVYLVDRVIPMLPERLSSDICSLRTGADKLALSVFLQLTAQGETTNTEFSNSIIRVRWQGTYRQVQEIIDGGTCRRPPGEDLIQMVRQMEGLRQHLTAVRADRGAIDFQIPEPEVVLDGSGNPVEVKERTRLSSHRLIEEFMLLANEAVAQKLIEERIPTLYRVHDRPDPVALGDFARVAEAFGHRFPKRAYPREIQEFVARIKGDSAGGVLNTMLLRTMKKATYTPENRGHFGLACKAYTHFTSPIRRYPDLLVHRQLKLRLLGKDRISERIQPRLPSLGDHATRREVTAQDAEWDSVKIKQIRFLATRVGQVFRATIVGIRPVGFFAELDEHLIQGLVKVRSLKDDFYMFKESDLTLFGQRTGRTFRLGGQVTVQVEQVDRRARLVDLSLVEGGCLKQKTLDNLGDRKRKYSRQKISKRRNRKN